ncbi:lipid IV(A) 3-deoxy-D-manno-octulosonic acid transferase [Campylobacter sp. 19-13652]|uniref:lipid IV(A) 3-deoxy-D-manno-octulosonic acid transferase n=1 Tax=Campylobacter sp. 19-13652 TaxID=2840180 RepID=UPI001C850957|nr:lipid IV(A) 3-deoxy-D-manno-octulosonic acid transferase [Campylobacter sp. 19-13652]
MAAIYYILCAILWGFALPFLWILSFAKDKYKKSIPARFWLANNPPFSKAKVHFHAASYGEIQALKPLISLFKNSSISVITQTGFEAAKKQSENTRFLPFEIFLPFWLKRSKVLVVFEAELWLMLVLVAKLKGARVILINARISDKSVKSYKRFAFFYRYLFRYIDCVYAQNMVDFDRLKFLGAKNIRVSGNIKSAFLPKPSTEYVKPKGRVVVFASTHSGEEELLLLKLSLSKNDKIIFAPRHPERFDEVSKLLQEFALRNGRSFARFSDTSDKFSADIILVDTLGELVNIYAISDIVVLCGSFIDGIGGHNPIEAAQFNPVIISGEFFFNQTSLYSLVEGITIARADEVSELLKQKNLAKSKISSHSNASEIIADIRRASGESV